MVMAFDNVVNNGTRRNIIGCSSGRRQRQLCRRGRINVSLDVGHDIDSVSDWKGGRSVHRRSSRWLTIHERGWISRHCCPCDVGW